MEIVKAKKVLVEIELEDGGRSKYLFEQGGELFDLGIDQPPGFPRAQTGGMTFSLPRWPVASTYLPAGYREEGR